MADTSTIPEDTIVTDPIVEDPIVEDPAPTDPAPTAVETAKVPIMKVVRFELYPKQEPLCYVVGFSISCPMSGRSIYREAQVSLDIAQTMTEEEIAQKAYVSIHHAVDSWMCENKERPAILGSRFIPQPIVADTTTDTTTTDATATAATTATTTDTQTDTV